MDGIELIKNRIDLLLELIAHTSLWVSPKVVEKLRSEENNNYASWCMNARRRFKNETRRTFADNIFLDDNLKANNVIKAALGLTERPKNFATCHIYDSSAYDSKFYTAIPNLVLIPIPIYSLADHLDECKNFLKYYSFIQYGFFIDIKPTKPAFWNKINLDKIIAPTDEQIKKALKSVDNRKRIINDEKKKTSP